MKGLDFLGLPKFKDVAVKSFPKGYALGAFATTFGDAYTSVEAIVKTGRCPVVRMQLVWDDNHAYGDKYIQQIKTLSKKYNKLAIKYSNVKFFLSPFCEHNLKNPDKYLDIVQQNAPICTPVNTIWKGKLSNKYINEIHSDNQIIDDEGFGYFFSFDGKSCVDADVMKVKKLHEEADIFFYWSARFNGKENDADKTPRPQRKKWPSKEYIQSVIYLAENNKGDVELPKKWLLKTHSEKEDKPVIICPLKAPKLELMKDNKIVDILYYYGTYLDGRHRYYSKKWGYQTSQKYGICEVWGNGKKIGTLNPAFREGEYR